MAPLKFKASPQECNFCNRKSLQFSKVAPLLLVASSASACISKATLTNLAIYSVHDLTYQI